MIEERHKAWTSFSFFASSMLAIYTAFTGQWVWTAGFVVHMIALYKLFNHQYRVYKDETNR